MGDDLVGALLIVLIVAAVGWFFVQVRWRVPAQAAARRRAILAGVPILQSAAGPSVTTGIAVDWGFAGRAATLAVFDDDTVILYFYPRSALVGSSRIRRLDDVVALGDALRTALRYLAPRFRSATQFPLPRPGEVTFHLMERVGPRMAGPMQVQDIQRAYPEFLAAHRLALRLLTQVCGTFPAVVPEAPISLATEDTAT